MKRNTLFYTSCIATASNNISSVHSATILTHTIACSHICLSEKNVIPETTSEANSTRSPLFLGRQHGKGQILFADDTVIFNSPQHLKVVHY